MLCLQTPNVGNYNLTASLAHFYVHDGIHKQVVCHARVASYRGKAVEAVNLSNRHRAKSGDSERNYEFEGAITKSCSADPQSLAA